MEKRLIIAIALSIFVIVTFQCFIPKPTTPVPEVKQVEQIPQAQAKGSEISAAKPQISVEEKELIIETDKYILTFSNIGGAIKNIRLKEYKNLNSTEPLDLVDIKDPREYIFSTSFMQNSALINTLAYDIEQKVGVITCLLTTKDLEITKVYNLHKSKNTIDLQLFIKNISSAPIDLGYSVVGGAGIVETNAQDKNLIEATANINAKPVGFRRPKKDERIINPGMVNWAALKTKYFSIILKPFTTTRGRFCSLDINQNPVMGLESDAVTIQPNSSVENKFLLYVGPSQISMLREAGYGLEESINYGFFGGISKVMIVAMRFFYNVTHSWGIAIILLSIFLNVILFPLTLKSFKSMQKMQELHPQMEKLKIQHKGNPQKLNKEIMELYKKYKINPFSGCVPMLLQMPVFISLYQALMKSIELRGTGFLWIKDLSAPDSMPLPMAFPIIGNSINILPVIMVAAMVLQQKISTKTMGSAVTEEQKQQQKMMLIIMPIMFGFIFYNMPSGLVLYWVVNTVLTIVEQGAILKKA